MIERVLLGLLLLFLATAADALPQPLQQRLPELAVVGQGELRWFGLNVYQATLWAPQGRYSPQRPFALEIVYRRDFTAQQLASASAQELLRLGYPDDQVRDWERHMERLFPSVRSGERITGFADGQGRALFYHDEEFLGAIDAPGFSEAFFSIWLDERTRNGRLRAALLGDRR